jgi:hypothetical protein
MSKAKTVHLQVKLVQLEGHRQHASLQNPALLVVDMLWLALTFHFELLLQT